jgi:pyruvyltransferase
MLSRATRYIDDIALKLAGGFIDSYHKREGAFLLYYFRGVPNVGDQLSLHIVKGMTNKRVVPAYSSRQPHLLAIGSILHYASGNSYIWGSGFLGPDFLPRHIDTTKITALRGRLSLELALTTFGEIEDIPLGDPAVLAPGLYDPRKLIEKKGVIGIIPHYADYNHFTRKFNSVIGMKVISVRSSPEAFIDEICSCDTILSSSLHGLILSDSYGIPNKRLVFGNRLLGAEFKFTDYYSTTDHEKEMGLVIDFEEPMGPQLRRAAEMATIKRYTGDVARLASAFPQL